MKLSELTVNQLYQSLKSGEISSTALIQDVFKRIENLDPQIKAFLTLTPELANQLAEKADRDWSAWRKNPDSPAPALLGIPLAIKDVLCLKDVVCTSGSKILENFKPPYSATSVQKLLDAGMIPIGKTNTDEFAMGSSTENSAYHTSRNPWDLERVPGGSSGGSAAAVAAGLVPCAMGTDTGGSVRQPASFCGVSGIKPTYGRVSRYGLVAYGSSLDSVGVLAYNVADTALIFSHMAGHDPRDATSQNIPSNQINLQSETSLKGLRIGVPQEYFVEGIQKEVKQAVHSAIEQLKNMGAEIQHIQLPHTEYALPVYYLIAPAEASANLARFDSIRYGLRVPANELIDMYRETRGAGFGPEVKRRIMLGTYALSAGYYDAYYGQAQKVRTLIKRDFETAFEKVDLIAAPVAPSTAFRFGEHTDDPLAMYLEDVLTLPANLAGIPALSLPVGFDHQHMPIGMQLMGPHFKEEILFQTGHAYQQTTNWHLQRPQL
ncbi:MAG: Asp-tRNA(Asn)/Glu-tRNA(Gln) amidotransferase subunit GatA [Anaerolineaceae bacterium]|nr:Asp-tRNA(Asn)/Glu-tRNA(Gln) amidotransferase subunit GatA [Anaerolineaceae bacterium]